MKTMRTYSELITIPNFLDRFRYLKLDGVVGEETFGSERYLNQKFYHSAEWRNLRNRIIVRDMGCDLGVEGFELNQRVYIHHMNPISSKDILHRSDDIMNPEYLICCSYNTHQAIHYGDETLLTVLPVERFANDTCPWKV